ncbi:MAG: hypothetical protein ACRC62_16855 [Microcoleus sp.]
MLHSRYISKSFCELGILSAGRTNLTTRCYSRLQVYEVRLPLEHSLQGHGSAVSLPKIFGVPQLHEKCCNLAYDCYRYRP